MTVLRSLIVLTVLLLALPGRAATDVRVVVDTTDLTLTVLRGGDVVERFDNIAIGRGGAAADRRHRDKQTPLGEFRISRVKHASDYHLFLGFNYPTREHGRRALEMGWIGLDDYRAIDRAERERRLPPQNTALGGYIGIHGLGNGDPDIHERLNWTEGCIAVTNEQIDRLARLVRLGTPVLVR